MECLGQISSIKEKIKLSTRATITALHKMVFEEEGNRGNRQRLRECKGFSFREDSDEFRSKLEYASSLSMGDLISICNLLGIDYTGTKDQVRRNIIISLMDIDSLVPRLEDEDEAEERDDDDERRSEGGAESQADSRFDDAASHLGEARRCVRNRRDNSMKFALSYKDVEDSIRPFAGEDDYPIERWVSDFEDAAILFEWDDLRKMVFAKRSLSGLAKTFIQGERAIRTWNQLRRSLVDEFSSRMNSADLHRMLAERKMKKGEGVREYSLAMKELASRGSIEEDALIEYVINGIPDDAANKVRLYGSKDFRDFKENLKIYERMRKSITESTKSFKMQRDEPMKKNFKINEAKDSGKKAVIRCFNCGETGHRSKECLKKAQGTKCFSCGEFGHIAVNCSKNIKNTEFRKNCNVVSHRQNKCEKDVVINGLKLVALIDSGSDITLIREEQYREIGSPVLRNRRIQFCGAGSGNHDTLGDVHINVCIDGETYPLVAHVVSDKLIPNGLLVGTDFLNTVEVNLKAGEVKITKIVEEDMPEVYKIDVIDQTEIDLSHLQDERLKVEVESMVRNYCPKKSKDVGVEMRIVLTDNIPIYQPARRLAVSEKKEVDTQMREWCEAGVIRPSTSDYASPIVLVRKKDGSARICVDFRRLNAKAVKVRYPQPVIEEQIDKLQDARIYTVLDLKNGFFHVPIEEDSRKYTAFSVPGGHYEFTRMPFGYCNSPAYFVKYIHAVFRQLIMNEIVIVYMDDIIVPSNNVEDGLAKLRLVLETASEYGILLNWKKCQFLRIKVTYLGHVIEGGKVSPSEDKSNAVKNFPKLTSIKMVQGFLGLTGYFRKFIPQYSIIARPLSDLLRNGTEFRFEDAQEQAFNELKKALSTKPILHLYRSTAETELHTDASALGFGAILLQRSDEDGKMHPVYYASGKTSPAEAKYDSYKLEVLAVVKALKKFRVYLIGISFTIITDCKAFTQTIKKKDLCAQVARWALLLEDFRYKIIHRPGDNMRHVDALSRHPLPAAMVIQECETGILARLRMNQEKDEELKILRDKIVKKEVDGYHVSNGLLRKDINGESLIVVPRLMQIPLIRQVHGLGHFACAKTMKLLRDDYWFQNMQAKVEKVIHNCLDCIMAEKKTGKKEGYLHPIAKEAPLDTYHIDHIGPMPSTKKSYRHILVVVDSFTKFVWLYPTKSTTSTEVVDRLVKQALVFGNPRRIISDRGTAFTSGEFEDFCKLENIEHSLIVTGVPRGNGQVERVNRTLIPLLTKLSAPHPDEWHKFVGKAQQYLNHAPSRSTGMSPFYLQFGVRMRLKEDPHIREILNDESLANLQEKRSQIREQAHEEISKIQAENKISYNRKRKTPYEYTQNDMVAIQRTQSGPGSKLCAKFLGPYKVTKVLRNDRYLVEKMGNGEGPKSTSTASDHMKPWTNICEDFSENKEELWGI